MDHNTEFHMSGKVLWVKTYQFYFRILPYYIHLFKNIFTVNQNL